MLSCWRGSREYIADVGWKEVGRGFLGAPGSREDWPLEEIATLCTPCTISALLLLATVFSEMGVIEEDDPANAPDEELFSAISSELGDPLRSGIVDWGLVTPLV